VVEKSGAGHAYSIYFFKHSGAKDTDPDSVSVSTAIEAVYRFHAQVVNAMRRCQFPNAASSAAFSPSNSKAKDLFKLWQMRETGALTEAEFAAQQELLLGKNEKDDRIHPCAAQLGLAGRV
jgi:hypothetical protein